MSSQNYPIPPVPSSPPSSGGVRRHHTITIASRSARNAAKESISEETPDQASIWTDDGPVDQDWVGNIGVVGEKTSLHRQASLPTRYNRGSSTIDPNIYCLLKPSSSLQVRHNDPKDGQLSC